MKITVSVTAYIFIDFCQLWLKYRVFMGNVQYWQGKYGITLSASNVNVVGFDYEFNIPEGID